MNITLDLTEHEIHGLVRDALGNGFERENKGKEWTEEEIKQAVEFMVRKVWGECPRKPEDVNF